MARSFFAGGSTFGSGSLAFAIIDFCECLMHPKQFSLPFIRGHWASPYLSMMNGPLMLSTSVGNSRIFFRSKFADDCC